MQQERITDEALEIASYIENTWPQFEVKVEQSLKELFPEPENKGLKHIWTYGSADIVVRRNGELVCIVEPGGAHHMQDEKQIKNDARKWKLCDIHGVGCLHIMNGTRKQLSKRKFRSLLGSFLFPKQAA